MGKFLLYIDLKQCLIMKRWWLKLSCHAILCQYLLLVIDLVQHDQGLSDDSLCGVYKKLKLYEFLSPFSCSLSAMPLTWLTNRTTQDGTHWFHLSNAVAVTDWLWCSDSELQRWEYGVSHVKYKLPRKTLPNGDILSSKGEDYKAISEWQAFI